MNKRRLVVLFSLFFLVATLFSNASVNANRGQTFTGQDVTAYIAPRGALTYHGTTPRTYITAAVKPKVKGDPRSGTIFPFGATITTDSCIQTDSGCRTSFIVEDMGQVNYQDPLSLYWFDLFYGFGSSVNGDPRYEAAKKFSVKRNITYTMVN
ncbi:hypothetical protein ABDI30_19905 [Paenibacillus cisolokensis]|uniref:hypothetical protein n=1 Tax=Paenibacillus cisolokensis TaxID=1658519 RepID=UPI003D2CA2F6